MVFGINNASTKLDSVARGEYYTSKQHIAYLVHTVGCREWRAHPCCHRSWDRLSHTPGTLCPQGILQGIHWRWYIYHNAQLGHPGRSTLQGRSCVVCMPPAMALATFISNDHDIKHIHTYMYFMEGQKDDSDSRGSWPHSPGRRVSWVMAVSFNSDLYTR